MSRKGCSQDNAAVEGFFGRLKTKLLYPRDWKTALIDQLVKEIDPHIHWCNEKRIKISFGTPGSIESWRYSTNQSHHPASDATAPRR